jgi:hypothetical protein
MTLHCKSISRSSSINYTISEPGAKYKIINVESGRFRLLLYPPTLANPQVEIHVTPEQRSKRMQGSKIELALRALVYLNVGRK